MSLRRSSRLKTNEQSTHISPGDTNSGKVGKSKGKSGAMKVKGKALATIVDRIFSGEAEPASDAHHDNIPGPSASHPPPAEKLSAIQKARLENNRQKALQIRRTKQAAEEQEKINKKKLQESVRSEVDSGAGFFLDDDDADFELDVKQQLADEPFVIAGDGSDVACEDCCRPFTLSFLRSKFDSNVCDDCYDREKHKLITKTNAKTDYLLKDVDLDTREPVLKFITKRNPRNNHWGEMKLYLESQVHGRALEIWGTMENVEEEKTKRKILSAKAKARKYDKKMKELKMAVRSSLYKKELSAHKHEYGEESYNEETDEYTSQCITCGHSITYEKM